jgi:hypothetical protein
MLQIHLMSGTDEGVHTGGCQTDTALLSLDLLGTTDTHKDAPFQYVVFDSTYIVAHVVQFASIIQQFS